MKILLLTSCNINKNKNLIINNCKDRFQFFSFIIYNYLKKYNNEDNIIIDNIYNNPLKKYGKMKNEKIFDHILFIENKSNNNLKYIKTLKKITKGMICRISLNNKYKYEDKIFYLTKSLKRNDNYYLDYPVDNNIYLSNQTFENIEILIDANIENIFYKKITNKILSFKKEHSNVDIKIKFKKKDKLIDDDIIKNNYYEDMIKKYGTCNIYFITDYVIDEYLLVELSMCNVLIVSLQRYVNKYLIDLFEIYIIENINFEFMKIINELPTHNIRDKLIDNGNLWENKIKFIYTKLLEYKSEDVNKEMIIKNIKKEKIIIKDDNKKRGVLIQSNLLKRH